MDCTGFDEHVIDALYGEADEATAAALEAHAAGCDRCRPAYAKLRSGLDLARLPLVPAPEGLEERILQAARRAEKIPPWPRRVLHGMAWAGSHAMRPQLAMAAVLVLMLGSSLVLIRSRRGEAPSAASWRAADGAAAPAAEAPSPAATAVVAATAEAFGGAARPSLKMRIERPETEDPQLAKSEPSPPPAVAAAPAAAPANDAPGASPTAAPPAPARPSAALEGDALSDAAAARGRDVGPCAEPIEKREVARRNATDPSAATWDAAECLRQKGEATAAEGLYAELLANEAFKKRAKAALANLRPPKATAGAAARPAEDRGGKAPATPPQAAPPAPITTESQ